jgi:hypothetical protein
LVFFVSLQDRAAIADVTRVAHALEEKNQAHTADLSEEDAAKKEKEKAKRSKKKESILQVFFGVFFSGVFFSSRLIVA